MKQYPPVCILCKPIFFLSQTPFPRYVCYQTCYIESPPPPPPLESNFAQGLSLYICHIKKAPTNVLNQHHFFIQATISFHIHKKCTS